MASFLQRSPPPSVHAVVAAALKFSFAARFPLQVPQAVPVKQTRGSRATSEYTPRHIIETSPAIEQYACTPLRTQQSLKKMSNTHHQYLHQ